MKLQLSMISDQLCEASDSPDMANAVAGYPVTELGALEVPEGAIRDMLDAFRQGREILGKFDGSKIKGLIEWWKANGDDVIAIITNLIALFSAFASPAPQPTPPAPPTY